MTNKKPFIKLKDNYPTEMHNFSLIIGLILYV